MDESIDSKARLLEFKSWFSGLPAAWPCASYLTSLWLSFLICNMETMIPTSNNVMICKWVNWYKSFSAIPCLSIVLLLFLGRRTGYIRFTRAPIAKMLKFLHGSFLESWSWGPLQYSQLILLLSKLIRFFQFPCFHIIKLVMELQFSHQILLQMLEGQQVLRTLRWHWLCQIIGEASEKGVGGPQVCPIWLPRGSKWGCTYMWRAWRLWGWRQ